MSAGSSSSTSRSFYKGGKPLFNQLVPLGQELLGQFQPSNPMRTAGEEQILKTLSGENMRPESNPYLQATADAITRNSEEAFQRNLASLSGQGQRAGMLYSTAAQKAGSNLARNTARDLSDRLTQLFGSNLAQERRYQVAAAPQAIGQGDYDLDNALRIASLLGGMGSSRSSNVTGGLF